MNASEIWAQRTSHDQVGNRSRNLVLFHRNVIFVFDRRRKRFFSVSELLRWWNEVLMIGLLKNLDSRWCRRRIEMPWVILYIELGW